jgi:pilus assembly protein FimV
MFITCQECNTTFRLDERLLKPTGSKVRCSQCGLIFVEYPPAPRMDAPVIQEPVKHEPPVAETAGEQELEGIDLAEFDAILEQDLAFAAERGAEDAGEASADETDADKLLDELDDADLDFDFDAALEPDGDAAGSESSTEEAAADEEIDLDMDFEIHDDTLVSGVDGLADLDLGALTPTEEPGGQEAVSPAGTEAADDDLPLDDLGLEIDDEAAPAGEKPSEEGPVNDDLGLHDLDFDLDEEDTEPEPVTEDQELSLDDDFEPEQPKKTESAEPAESALEAELGEEALAPDEEIDLSDLDALMATSGEVAGDRDADSGGIDLELEMEDDTPSGEAPLAQVPDQELEDLDFSLDDEFEDKPREEPSRAGDTMAEEEIDLSDIEQMLGDDTAKAEEKQQPAWPEEGDLGMVDEDEINLAEIESAIDEADSVPEGETGGGAPEDLDLELDLDIDMLAEEEAAPDDALLELAGENEPAAAQFQDMELELEMEDKPDGRPVQAAFDNEELDLSDLGDLVEDRDLGSGPEVVHSGDIELEFHIEDDEDTGLKEKAAGKKRAASETAALAAQAEETRKPEKKAARAAKPFKRRRKTSKSLVFLFILILLGAGGYGLHQAVIKRGVEIPYVSDYVRQATAFVEQTIGHYMPGAPKDPDGIMNLSTLDISSRFIENEVSDRLFVITGKVRNGYSAPREMIRVQGHLYTRGKVLAQTEFSYAGLTVEPQDLATRSIVEIHQLLKSVPQDRIAATAAPAGQNLPFMLVFSNLPPADQLDEFAIELTSSAPAR